MDRWFWQPARRIGDSHGDPMNQGIPISALDLIAKQRAPGYKDAVLAVATVRDDKAYLSDKDFKIIQRKFALPQPIHGLGDLISIVATPIAAILEWPCVDPATKQLKPESECAKLRDAANKAVPFTQLEKP